MDDDNAALADGSYGDDGLGGSVLKKKGNKILLTDKSSRP
jgi:hypothetical protein